MESAISGSKKISRKIVIAFLSSGSVLIGVPKVLRELCGCECTLKAFWDSGPKSCYLDHFQYHTVRYSTPKRKVSRLTEVPQCTGGNY